MTGLVPTLIAIALATLVICCYVLFIWWLDRYEREPLWVVILTFFFGASFGTCFSCIVNSSIQQGAVQLVGANMAKIFTTVMVAPTVEEFMKGMVFIPLLLLGKNVDNKTDGLIYGAAVGLGFAMLENLWYYGNNFDPAKPQALLGLIFMRTLFSALVHCVSSSLLGMSIGHASHRSGIGKLFFPVLGYLSAVAFHGTWNGIATFVGFLKDDQGAAAAALLVGCALVLGAGFFMFIITQLSLHGEHKVIRAYLLDEAKSGVLPAQHAEIIPFWLRRMRGGWVPQGVNKRAYIRAATMLAFRRHQMEMAGEHKQNRYMEDVVKYRKEVRDLLGKR